MKNIKIAIWFFWFLLVILWNYGYPSASPFLDVLVAALLAGAQVLILKILTKK
tara:strand:+ start:683 stop:841 length:159 start_codon:yes stop_codon:yes gene_type:complete